MSLVWPDGRRTVGIGDPGFGGITKPSAPPARKPAASRPMEVRDTAVIDLMNALEEMFPEMGAGERSMMARQLADEYMRERGAAKAELRPKHPQAPPTEQMQFDEAWGEMRDQEALAGRTQKRINAALRDEGRPRAPKMGDARPIMPQGQGEPYGDEPVAFDGFHRGKQRDDDNYRREQQKRQELQTAREMALGAEREVFRKTGQRGPTQHDEARRRTQRKADVEQFKLFASGQASPRY